MNNLEAQQLAHGILLDIEENSKDLHLLCLQASRLALLLNNTTKSKEFSADTKNCSKMEAFLASYGLIINDLIKTINLEDIYEIESNNLSGINQREMKKVLASFSSNSIQKDPIEEIEKFYLYKQQLNDIKSNIYEYALDTHYQLVISENVKDIFTEYEYVINEKLPSVMSDSREKLDSISKNLNSQNPQDWSNAVHTCRKLLQSLSDGLYPPSEKPIHQDGKEIHLGKSNYINRLIKFIENNQMSKNYNAIVGSHLKYIGERLEAVYKSANKGSHETITSIEEAKRYIIYTYLLVGDILQLNNKKGN